MKLTQFVATPDGGSRFEDIDIALDKPREGAGGYTLMASEAFAARGVCFVSLPDDLDQDWHPAPARQFVYVVAGTVEVQTSDDQVRRWHSGDIFIAADVTGRGHQTRVIEGPATVMFIPLADGALD